MGRLLDQLGGAGRLRAARLVGCPEAGPGRRVLGRPHGLRPSRLLYMWRRDRAGRQRELGAAWGEVVARRLKWKLIYQGHTDATQIPSGALTATRQQFGRELRERLPEGLRDIVFEVDVAAEESRAFNPMTETADILIYDPLEDRFQRSPVLDLFTRLPVRMCLFRTFAPYQEHRGDLIRAANDVL